jgi:signal transduction histidine kinase
MLQIADRVGKLNEEGLQQGDQQVAGLFERLRLGLLGMIGVTLMGGSALAVYTSVMILRLQDEVRRSLKENIEAKTNLRELSAKLVRAHEEERRSLSRELHDEAGQSFSAILLETENLLDLEHVLTVRPHLESIRDMAQHGLAVARNMALLLRPSMLDDFGLVAALNWQAKETSKRTGLRIQVTAADLPNDLPEEHKTCIYRIVQEALNNVAKHAQASAAHIKVERTEAGLELTVQDDGSGFDAERVRGLALGGLGLLGMQERVHHLGGEFLIDSQPGRGTLLRVNLPVSNLALQTDQTDGIDIDVMNATNTHTVGRRS